MTTALIDADILAYRMAAWCQANQIDALEGRDHVISVGVDWSKAVGADHTVMVLSHPTEKSFRYQVLPTYKHNRKDAVPPEFRRLFEQVLRDEFRSIERQGLEADDLLGVMMTNGKVEDPICISIDKDLLQIPGEHFNPVKGERTTITPELGLWKFHLQWLTGDPTDGYGGVAGIGPKKAEGILAPFWEDDGTYRGEEAEKAVVQTYDDKGYDFTYCVQMAQIAKILTAPEWDPKTNLIRLFEPETRF